MRVCLLLRDDVWLVFGYCFVLCPCVLFQRPLCDSCVISCVALYVLLMFWLFMCAFKVSVCFVCALLYGAVWCACFVFVFVCANCLNVFACLF